MGQGSRGRGVKQKPTNGLVNKMCLATDFAELSRKRKTSCWGMMDAAWLEWSIGSEVLESMDV